MKLRIPALLVLFSISHLHAGDPKLASDAINGFGLDLHRLLAKEHPNLCTSPLSLESALAMTYAGARGETREQMAKALHFPVEDAALHESFATLTASLETLRKQSEERAEQSKKYGGQIDPLAFANVNRLYGQAGYPFRETYLDLLKKTYQAPLETVDFAKAADQIRQQINKWVEEQTRTRIKDLIPANGVNGGTRLVLVNALYLKAAWEKEFSESFTKPLPFHMKGEKPEVPTMHSIGRLGYTKGEDYSAIGIPYFGRGLQFLIVVPDDIDGLAKVEAAMTAKTLSSFAKMEAQEVDLYLPKFKMEPPTLPLAQALEKLGMTQAFNKPEGSANFDGMAPRTPNDYLFISEVFHKTFIAVDEKGTEAAAATAVSMMAGSAMREPPKPVVVRVDRPFLFAIQETASGACLFLGRVSDPR